MTQEITSNGLVQVMRHRDRKLLNIYCTAGYPELGDTARILTTLEAAGADMVEIGMPFSDPLADGPTIQQSNMRALENGMTLELLFEQLSQIDLGIPVILMGYFNPVLQYGVRNFCDKCGEVGVSGVIIPDLPMHLYQKMYQQHFVENDLCNIGLVTPQTSNERVLEIDQVSSGFIYAVSSASTTGRGSGLSDTGAYLERLSNLGLKNPIMTGFNITDKESFDRASKHTRGGIIGSAFIKAIAREGKLESNIYSFVKSIKS